MVTFIDGPQISGKTTLCQNLVERNKAQLHKFPFSQYTKAFGFQEDLSALNGFQVAKDLACLHWLDEFRAEPYSFGKKILIDRGPLSTAYYSFTHNRLTEDQLDKFWDAISYYSHGVDCPFSFIFMVGVNKPVIERQKADGFDHLRLHEDEKDGTQYICQMAKMHGLPFKFFENDFSKPVKDNADRLLKEIYKLGARV